MAEKDRQATPTGRKGNNLDDVRRNNLAAVLNLAHVRGRLSRADVTRATGLNRSTVAGLVAELVERGLVEELEPGVTRHAGRPSPIIVPRDDVVAIAVNPEVDAVTIGLVSLSGKVLKRIRYDTARIPSPEEVVNIVRAVIAGMRGELDSSFHTVGVGVAVPGLVRAADGEVVSAPHLDWHGIPLSNMLSAALKLPVTTANDASTGLMAESTFGAGRGGHSHIYLNGGASGIGGGITMNGQPLLGASGFAGEFGHSLVNSNGTICHCGRRGCLETEVQQAPLLEALGLSRTEVEKLDSTLLDRFERPEGPEPSLRELVHRQVDHLAESLSNIVNVLNPELIILGGFLGSLYATDPNRMEEIVKNMAITGPGQDVHITRAALGLDLLLVGAAQLAFGPVLRDPASISEPVELIS